MLYYAEYLTCTLPGVQLTNAIIAAATSPYTSGHSLLILGGVGS